MNDIELKEYELEASVQDSHENRLSDIELSAYVSAVYANGLSLQETKHLTRAMTDIGQQLSWDAPVVADKHSIGGVAGNGVTPIIASIVAETNGCLVWGGGVDLSPVDDAITDASNPERR